MKKWQKWSLYIGVPVVLVVASILGTMWVTQEEGPVSCSEMSIDRFERLVEERDALNDKIKFFMRTWEMKRKRYERVLENQPGTVPTSVN